MTPVELAIEVVGWAGAILILLAYMLISADKLSGQSRLFQWMNVVGAAGIAINAWWHGAWPAVALDVAWMIIGGVALWQIMRKSRLVDLSHVIEHGMTTYPGLPGPNICDFWTREGSAANYDDGSTFQIGRIDMVANTGTYVDSPFHRYADGRRSRRPAAGRRLADLPGIVVRRPWENELATDASHFDGPRGRAARRCWSTPAGTGTGGPNATASTTAS